MKKLKLITLSLAATFMLSACGGGGGGGNNSTGGVYYTHSQLANEFVRRLGIDLGWDVELVKTHTLQYDYIVIYDWDYGSYDAYYIGNYRPGQDLFTFVRNNNWRVYYDLIPEVGNFYFDPVTGTRFERTGDGGKNLTTFKAIEQDAIVMKASQRVSAQYGLSEEKSVDLARFAYRMQTAPEGTYQASDLDDFSKEFIGSSISDFQRDFSEGNLSSLASRIEQARMQTGMSPEAMNALIEDVFMQ